MKPLHTYISTLVISASILIAISVYSRLEATTDLELEKSCQAGALIYVTSYPEELPVLEKRKRIHKIAMGCRKFVDTYLENR